MQRLLGVNKVAPSDLAKRGIVQRGDKRGTYRASSITALLQAPCEMAAGRGGEAGADVRARLGAAQADLAAEKVKAMRRDAATAEPPGG